MAFDLSSLKILVAINDEKERLTWANKFKAKGIKVFAASDFKAMDRIIKNESPKIILLSARFEKQGLKVLSVCTNLYKEFKLHYMMLVDNDDERIKQRATSLGAISAYDFYANVNDVVEDIKDILTPGKSIGNKDEKKNNLSLNDNFDDEVSDFRHDATDASYDHKSVLNKKYVCSLHEENNVFKAPALKSSTLKIEQNPFNIGVYTSAMPDKLALNFSPFDIRVCPICLFASSDINQLGGKDEYSKTLIHKYKKTQKERDEIFEPHSQDFFTINRTLEDGLIANLLAIHTAKMFFDSSPDVYHANLVRIGLYHLRCEELYFQLGNEKKGDECLKNAFSTFENAYKHVDTGAVLFQVMQNLVAIGVYIEDDKAVGSYLNTFTKNIPEIMNSISAKQKTYADSTLKIIKETWSERDYFRRGAVQRPVAIKESK